MVPLFGHFVKNILQTNLPLCRFAQTENLEDFFRQSCLKEGGAVWALSEALFGTFRTGVHNFFTVVDFKVNLRNSKDKC